MHQHYAAKLSSCNHVNRQKRRAGKSEIRRRGEVGGRLSPAEPDAGATASARDMKRLISMVCPTTPTLRKKRKEKNKSCIRLPSPAYTSKQQYEMGIRLVLRIIFAVVWSSQLTSGSWLPFELRKLHVFRINGLEIFRYQSLLVKRTADL
jgi:hypothetical protein